MLTAWDVGMGNCFLISRLLRPHVQERKGNAGAMPDVELDAGHVHTDHMQSSRVRDPEDEKQARREVCNGCHKNQCRM